ncbi:MAG: hypothetical protein QNJ98_05095 [Planctomycetota bacterium]|nr:hypothetical protein [Planctomycetota bacterium]
MNASEGPTGSGGRLTPYLPIMRAVLYAVLLIVLQLSLIFVSPPDDPMTTFGENGRLEIAQVVLLVLAAGIAISVARTHANERGLGILIAGLVVAVLVREHNNDLKAIDIPRLWQMLVGAVIGGTVVATWPMRKSLPGAIARFGRTTAFPWVAACVMTLVFVQALDEKGIWVPILGEEFPYAVRRVGEETCELLAYWFFLVGMFEWRLGLPRRSLDGGEAPGQG